METVLKWLPLSGIATAILLGGIAWGTQDKRIDRLEDAFAQQTTLQTEQSEMKEQSARVDERTKAMQDTLQRQEMRQLRLEDMLQQLLQRSQ